MRFKLNQTTLWGRMAGSMSLALLFVAGCKPSQQAQTESILRDSPAKISPTPSLTPDSSEQTSREKGSVPAFRTGPTATDWLNKKNVSEAEAKTVDALLDSIEAFGGPSGNPTAAARWAEGRLQVAFLADHGLTDISPILAFRRIVTLYVTGNKFTQQQFDALLANLPNLKTVVKDPYIQCDNIKYPNITCLE